MAGPIRLIIADDHPIVLQGLEHFFNRQEGFTVVATCRDGDEALAAVKKGGADVLVLDLRMPGRGGLDVLRAMALDPAQSVHVVLLTGFLPESDVGEAVRLGAKGIVLKESPPEALIDCVRQVAAGERWIDRPALTRVLDQVVGTAATSRAQSDPLTARELEVVRLVAQGLRNREIGERLFISEGTVKIHLHNIYEKLGVDGRLELLLCAQDRRLV